MGNPSLAEKRCLDIVRPFAETLDDCYLTSVQLFGGIGSAALEHSGLNIGFEAREITVPAGALDDLKCQRPDGTLRDLDFLVLSSDEDEVTDVENLAKTCIADGDLELSFFGLRPINQLQDQLAHPLGSLATVHLSDRYVQEEVGHIVEVKKALFPFVVDMPVDALQTWRLDIGGEQVTIPIPHPGATILNYLTRSVSGLRPKDARKVDKLVSNIARVEPEVIDWVTNGNGASQFEFARLLHTLRSFRGNPQPLIVGDALEVKPYDLSKLSQHKAFGDFVRAGRPGLMKLLIEAEHIKSRGLHFAEKQERIVTTWQGHVESHVQGLVKNK
jgi:hypothetical protein